MDLYNMQIKGEVWGNINGAEFRIGGDIMMKVDGRMVFPGNTEIDVYDIGYLGFIPEVSMNKKFRIRFVRFTTTLTYQKPIPNHRSIFRSWHNKHWIILGLCEQPITKSKWVWTRKFNYRITEVQALQLLNPTTGKYHTINITFGKKQSTFNVGAGED